MNKEEIIELIKRTSKQNNDVPLGQNLFHKSTPVKKSDWYGKIWTKWSDAIKEAGYTPNEFTKASPIEELYNKLARAIKKLGKYPTESELRFIHNQDKTLPSTSTIKNRIGNKNKVAEAILKYCNDKEEYKDVVKICQSELARNLSKTVKNESIKKLIKGYVYLMKSGKYYKIGKADHVGNRNYNLGIKLPESIDVVHTIPTDDPFGIEKYWHSRFSDKRKGGEWFDLSSDDIKAFKRRKNYM